MVLPVGFTAGRILAGGLNIGDAYEGGYYAGQINDGGTIYNLVISPKSGSTNKFQFAKQYDSFTSGASSRTNGPANTLSASTSTTNGQTDHLPSNSIYNLTYNGYSDWYIPAIDELQVLYANMKPSSDASNTSYGSNANSVPPRGNYTANDPLPTSFSYSIALEASTHFSSTQDPGNNRNFLAVYMPNGEIFGQYKKNISHTRAIRRVVA